MKWTNLLLALAAFCILVVPTSSMIDHKGVGYGSTTICPMNLSEKGLESINEGQLKKIMPQNMEGFGKIIPGHWERLRLEEIEESDNTDLAKLIARKLIKQIEVMQPQASAWLLTLTMSGLVLEQWERVLLSMATYAYKL